MEAIEEIFTVHCLKIPKLLRDTLYSMNPIGRAFPRVRIREKNIKWYRGRAMAQDWLIAAVLSAEKRFHKVAGYMHIPRVVAAIEVLQAEEEQMAT